MTETSGFLRDCIELAIDGFLFRGISPSDHYYRFSQSFPLAFSLLSHSSSSTAAAASASNSLLGTPKQTHRPHSSKRAANVPLLDLSSLNANVLLEQQPVSTILSTGLTIKTKKPVYSPKDSTAARRPNKTPLVTSNSPNTPLSSNDPSPALSKRPLTSASPSSEPWHSPQPLSQLEVEAREIQERMARHRVRHSRPANLAEMNGKQIYEEKCDMQQELLRFENKFSKPNTSEQKRIMKPLYDYYRQLKRLVEQQQQTH